MQPLSEDKANRLRSMDPWSQSDFLSDIGIAGFMEHVIGFSRPSSNHFHAAEYVRRHRDLIPGTCVKRVDKDVVVIYEPILDLANLLGLYDGKVEIVASIKDMVQYDVVILDNIDFMPIRINGGNIDNPDDAEFISEYLFKSLYNPIVRVLDMYPWLAMAVHGTMEIIQGEVYIKDFSGKTVFCTDPYVKSGMAKISDGILEAQASTVAKVGSPTKKKALDYISGMYM